MSDKEKQELKDYIAWLESALDRLISTIERNEETHEEIKSDASDRHSTGDS